MTCPVKFLLPAASPMIAKQVAVNHKLSTARMLYMTIPAMLPLTTADIMLNADMPLRSARMMIMTIRRIRACPSGVWMKSKEDGEKVKMARNRLFHLDPAGGGALRAGSSSGK